MAAGLRTDAERGSFIASLRPEAIAAETIGAVRGGIADCVGVAFVNAVAAHALDFDDTGLDGSGRSLPPGCRRAGAP